MLTLLTCLALAQAPSLPPAVTAEAEAPRLRAFLDTHLLDVGAAVGGVPKVRQAQRSFLVSDDEWATAFALVPAAHQLALQVQRDYRLGTLVAGVGVGVELVALLGASTLLVLTMVSAVAPALVVTLALVCAAVALVGAAVGAVSLPALMRANEGFLEAVAVHNHGLVNLTEGAAAATGLLTVPLPL